MFDPCQPDNPLGSTRPPPGKPPKTSRDVAMRYAGYTSLQGIPFINRASRWYSKIFWSLVFMASLAAMLYQTYKVFHKYYKYETTTSVSIGYDKLSFPSLTLCNINPIRLSKANEIGGSIKEFVSSLDPKDQYHSAWYDTDEESTTESPEEDEPQIRKKVCTGLKSTKYASHEGPIYHPGKGACVQISIYHEVPNI